MQQKDKIIAIVPAAGVGKRFSDSKNKAFEPLGGKPLIIWALETLESMTEVQEIIPVLREADMGYGAGIFEEYRISRVRRIAPGGKERQDSVFNGLKLIENSKCTVLIHDGVRPFIDVQTARDAFKQLQECDGAVCGVPVKDTIKEVKGDTVQKTLKRGMLWAIQTPQLFKYASLVNAYEKAMKEKYYSTDDAALVERFGGRVKVVRGSYNNIKITTPEDMLIAETLLDTEKAVSAKRQNPDIRI